MLGLRTGNVAHDVPVCDAKVWFPAHRKQANSKDFHLLLSFFYTFLLDLKNVCYFCKPNLSLDTLHLSPA